MARRSMTGSARSNEVDPVADNGGDSGVSTSDPATASEPGAGASTSSAQDTGGQGANAQGTEGPPKVKRKRGPNKPKPSNFGVDFVVEAKAHMKQEDIVKLLMAHATSKLGADVAANMALQVVIDGEYQSLEDALPLGATLRFGTGVQG